MVLKGTQGMDLNVCLKIKLEGVFKTKRKNQLFCKLIFQVLREGRDKKFRKH